MEVEHLLKTLLILLLLPQSRSRLSPSTLLVSKADQDDRCSPVSLFVQELLSNAPLPQTGNTAMLLLSRARDLAAISPVPYFRLERAAP